MTVTAQTTITTATYQTVLSSISRVLNTSESGYGVVPRSVPVAPGSTITLGQWQALYTDVNRTTLHQTGNSVNINGAMLPSTATIASRVFVNSLQAASDTAFVNSSTVALGQLTNYTTSSVRTTNWGAEISHEVTYVWPDEESANWHFNLGGYITTDLGFVPGTGVGLDPSQETLVMQLITGNRAELAAPFNRAAWLSTKTAPGNQRAVVKETTITNGVFTGTFTASVVYEILSTANLNDTIRSTVKLLPDTSDTFAADLYLDVVATSTNYWSNGGIEAIDPEVTLTNSFENSIALANRRNIRTLSVSQPSYEFFVVGGSNSAAQTIAITNNILDPDTASTATITELVFTADGATPVFSPALPISVAPGQTVNVSLYWSKPTITGAELGRFNNSLRIVSNNTKGDIVVPIIVEVTKPPFEISMSPTDLVVQLTSYKSLLKNFVVTPSFGVINQITASISGHPNFTLIDQGTAARPVPVIKYNPRTLTDATYPTTLTVVVTATDITGLSQTRTVSTTWTVEQNLSDINLGTWISAPGPYNSIVGASYDIIDGQRYVTLGIGTGADGSPIIDNGGTALALVGNLGALGDIGTQDGLPLYKLSADMLAANPAFSQLIRDYGVWAGRDLNQTVNQMITKTYSVTASADGMYNWQFAVDDQGYFKIDGVDVGDLRAANGNNWVTGTSGSVYLTAGSHSLELAIKNTGGPAGVGLLITDPSDNNAIVWSTLTPVRDVQQYKYWAEVYRFPISNQSTTFNSKDYCVKDTGPVSGARFGNYFGSGDTAGSVFKVLTDGNGQVDILMNPVISGVNLNIENSTTLGSLFYSFYYYQTAIPRYSHLLPSAPANNITPYFSGFSASGGVNTTDRTIPTRDNPGPDSDSNIVKSAIVFFLSSVLADAIVIQTGLLIANAGQAVSLGAYVLQAAGVNIGSAATILEYITSDYLTYTYALGGEAAIASGSLAAAGSQALIFLSEIVVPVVIAAAAVAVVSEVVDWVVDNPKTALGLGAIAVAAVVATCFTPDTLVDMADDTRKPIKDIEIGDLVWNHDRTLINRVTMKDRRSTHAGQMLWSPSKDVTPFATDTHPLFLNNRLSVPNPSTVYEIEPWFGKLAQADEFYMGPVNGQYVYNFYTTGDFTFRVNGYGTTTMLFEPNMVGIMLELGMIKFEDTVAYTEIFDAYAMQHHHAIYGGALLNKFATSIDWKILYKLSSIIYKSPKLMKLGVQVSRWVGWIGHKLKKPFDKL